MKLLILSSVWVEPNSSAAGTRMLQLIAFFNAQGYSITYASTSHQSPFATDLETLGVCLKQIALNNSSFDVFVQELQPAVVLFDRFIIEEQFGWRIADHCPSAIRILDTEDLHCLRKGRELAIKEHRTFEQEDLLVLPIAQREIASILRCDLSLIISTFEMQVLETIFKIDSALLFYIPFLVSPLAKESQEKLPKFEQRKDFYFVGNFLHQPNLDAVIQLKNELWKPIRASLPQANLHIYGAYPKQQVLEMHKPAEGFYVHGRAEDVNAISQEARICLAPLRFGAGLKGKLLEAMQNGTPSVTTAIGAEAMAGNLPWSGAVATDTPDFVSKAIQIYSDESLWLQAQQNGFTILNTVYDKVYFEDLFLQRLQMLKKQLESHRKQNFLGRLLLQEQYRSTKFMALWIEGKNG